MRRFQKKILTELAQTLFEAHESVKKQINGKNIEAARSLIADCQDTAVRMSESIGQSEGEECPTVKLLNEYRMLLFQMYNQIPSGANGNNILKTLNKSLAGVDDSIKFDIKVRLEAVFLPYNASMWDSLESVYLAAAADENCDAYVVPIPYYEKNADGSFGKMHYEGHDLPPDIPVIAWEEYSLEARRPDVIFIHNPYDDRNDVTSIHPSFYAKELKKYTDMLVYIPFFVLEEIDPDNLEAVNSISHFCYAPGIIYADRVIVQSEKMRRIYINEFKKAAERDGFSFTKKHLEAKFLGLGSPKFDRIASRGRERCEMPAEWGKFFDKPDGTRKKIVMYNNTVGTLLDYGDKVLDKMEDVFRIFRENRDEIAFWWRPHPLIQSTIKATRPGLWRRYSEIVDRYRREGWGIYDDTADLDRAVVCSDAYYGDRSSLIELFKAAGKDVMIQEPMCTPQIYDHARFLDCCDDGDNLWFVDHNSSKLYRYIRSEHRTEFLCALETGGFRYRAICRSGNKLYAPPYHAEDTAAIAVYDIEKNTSYLIPIDTAYLGFNVGYDQFVHTYPFGKYVFFVPCAYQAIIRLDTESDKLEYFTDFIDKLENYSPATLTHNIMVDKSLYLTVTTESAVVEFDMVNCRSYIHKISDSKVGYWDICFDGKNFWLLHSSKDAVTKWCKETGEVTVIKLSSGYYFQHIEAFPNYILTVSWRGDTRFNLIDRDNEKKVIPFKSVSVNAPITDTGRFLHRQFPLHCVKPLGEELLVYSTLHDTCFIFDMSGKIEDAFMSGKIVDAFETYVPGGNDRSDFHDSIIAKAYEDFEHKVFLYETPYESRLECYVDYIETKKTAVFDRAGTERIGERIWNQISPAL